MIVVAVPVAMLLVLFAVYFPWAFFGLLMFTASVLAVTALADWKDSL